MRNAYAAVTPDPDHFEAFAAKTVALVQGFGGWTDDELRSIEVPVLVLIGDTDFILDPKALEAVGLLTFGQHAVLPGTTHMGMTRSTLVAPVVEASLQGQSQGGYPEPEAESATELHI